MLRKSASTIATGGAGYTFADKVAAAFLVQLLKRMFPLESDLGVITEVHFETRDAGRSLDDLQLSLSRGPNVARCFISVKSNRQLTRSGFNKEFVQDAWQEWNRAGGASFDRERDILAIIVGDIDESTLQEWQALQKQAAATSPDRLSARLQNDGQFTATQRAIFDGLRQSTNGQVDEIETARLTSRLRVLHFSDAMEGTYINFASEIVRHGSLEDGARLWARLLQVASENRATGGYFDLQKLIEILRPDFDLQDHPDFRNDWNKIQSVTEENVKAVRSVIGSGIHLARAEARARLASEVKAHKVVVVSGESGSGKSATLSQLVTAGDFQRTLWFSAEQLSKASQAEVATGFNLSHGIPALIKNSGMRDCLLVLDGFERFEGEARARGIDLLRAVREEGFVGWTVIITCQPQSWKLAMDALAEAAVDDAHRVDFEKPALREILDVVGNISGIRPLLLRVELQPILRNLMVLDWVLRADVAQRFSPERPWIGETEIIDCIWERWLGASSLRLARDALLRTLGRGEGDKISGAVHVDTIPATELPLLGELANEGLIRISGPSIQFTHDLMGDWARYRILRFAGNDAADRAKALAHIPRWGRAIRLYGQFLAEHGTGLEKWKEATAGLSGDNPESRLAADLLLDGLLFAANSEYLLEQVWPDLLVDDAEILGRLLQRLVHVASFPDWRPALIDPKLAEYSEARFRIPQPLYWIPVLRVLSRHSADVAAYALMRSAEVCALWLRTMPVGVPGRREAGLIALELAKEAQALIAAGMHLGDKDKTIYEALLSAAPEFPDGVSQIALQLSGRQDGPEHASEEEAPQAKPGEKRVTLLRSSGIRRFRGGPLRPPAADGPLRTVPDGFHLAVMDTPALNGLISVRPEVAREVLLAVCIEEPKRWDPYSQDRLLPLDRLGLTSWQAGYPAMYWKGPFLKFLQEAPSQGLDSIVRLVNFATERWLEAGLGPNVSADAKKEYSLEFEANGKTLTWVGGGNVFAWNRLASLDGATVECALMALEKWLCDELENRRSIAEWIDYIFAHGSSLALAGVLVSVGLRFQGLFVKKLRPLLGNFYLYQTQMSLALTERDEAWKISWAGQPEPAVKLAADWHDKGYRRILLRDIASTLMLESEETKTYLSERKAEWAKLPRTEKGRLDMEFFLAHFDPANYTQTPQDDGQVLVTMSLPPHLQVIAEKSQTESMLKMLALSLALRARRLLEGEETLRPEDLPEFAANIQKLANWKDTSNDGKQDHYRISSIAGGIAVLVIQHRRWLSQNAELERWCFDTLRVLKPVRSEDLSPVSMSYHEAEIFLGEAGVALLQESSDEWVLRLAFDGATGWQYASTFFTLWRAYLLFDALGYRFGELVNVVVMWSALRHVAIREVGFHGHSDQSQKYRSRLLQRYLSGRLKGPLIPMSRAEALGRRLGDRMERKSMSAGEKRAREEQRKWAQEHRAHRRLDRDMPEVDFEVLQKGFGFIAGMARYPVAAQDQVLEEYVKELFDLEMHSLPRAPADDDRSEIEGTPWEFDRWIMARVAEFMARRNSLETARTFCRPIVELGPAAKYWVESFLQSWISQGLPLSPDLRGFARMWEDMATYAETLPSWQPAEGNYWSRAEGLAANLMGLSESGIAVLGDAKYKDLVSSMSPTFARWCDRWLRYASFAGWFAYFLRTESGRILLPQGIKQLATVVGSFPDRDWRPQLGELITEALSEAWKHLRGELERDASLREAFFGVLAVLCARQTPEALHLRTRVSEFLQAS